MAYHVVRELLRGKGLTLLFNELFAPGADSNDPPEICHLFFGTKSCRYANIY